MGIDCCTATELVEFDDHLAGAFSIHVTVSIERDVVVNFCDHVSILFEVVFLLFEL